jgi:hypothetical protein
MKKLINLIFVTASVLIAVSCSRGTSNAQNQSEMQNINAQVYTCTMHPEVQSDKPGKCPKCGMELVIKD